MTKKTISNIRRAKKTNDMYIVTAYVPNLEMYQNTWQTKMYPDLYCFHIDRVVLHIQFFSIFLHPISVVHDKKKSKKDILTNAARSMKCKQLKNVRCVVARFEGMMEQIIYSTWYVNWKQYTFEWFEWNSRKKYSFNVC